MGCIGSIGTMKRWFWVLDVLTVLAFVAIGRDSHGFVSDWVETARTSAPFLIALGVGIVLTRAWRRPTSLLTGLALAAVTVVLGMLLRRFVFDRGTALTFVLLTTGWMVYWMVGWRLAVGLVARFRENRRRAAAT